MTTTDVPQYGAATASELGSIIYDKAGAFMLAPPTAEKAVALGFPDALALYVAGRLGVIGDAVPEVAATAHGFLNPAAAREIWPTVGQVCSRAEAAETFAQACADFGEANLSGFAETDAARLADLAERVVDAAPATPLFAAWRAVERPESPRARAAHLLNLLREWRGGVHIAALSAAGVTPLEAIMSDGGAFYAEAFGWPQPWPAEGGVSDRLVEVAAAVDAACGRVIAEQLSDQESTELVALAGSACALL